jgi:cytochrome b6-f complex iron-sulfur subunit
MKSDEAYLARRRFLCGMLCGGATAMGAGVLVPLVQYAGNLHATPPPEFVTLEKADYQLSPGKGKFILYGHIPVLLLQPSDSASPLRVFVASCTHLNCTVSYEEDRRAIYCACHEGVYDLAGRVVSGPPPGPLRQLFTKVSNGKLILALEKDDLDKAS